MEDLKIISCTEDCLPIISEESVSIKGSDAREYNISTSKGESSQLRTITIEDLSSDGTCSRYITLRYSIAVISINSKLVLTRTILNNKFLIITSDSQSLVNSQITINSKITFKVRGTDNITYIKSIYI